MPAAPGGTLDQLTRVLGDKLEQALGVAVYVEDKPGARTDSSATTRRRAHAPDGYTFLAATTSTHVMTPHVGGQPAHTIRCRISRR